MNKKVSFKESCPVAKEYVIHAVVARTEWQGGTFKTSQIRIDHCCADSVTYCDELCPQKSDAPAGGRDPKNFLKLLHKGEPVEACPFCGALVRIVVHEKTDGEQWY